MGCTSTVMVPLRTGAGGLVGGRTQGVVRGLEEGHPGQGCQPWRACPLRGHSPRPWHRMEDSGTVA